MTATPSLQVTELVCGYSERALFAPLSFALTSGQAVQVMGANGRGKTTLFRAIAGLGQPLSGDVTWVADNELHEELCFIGHSSALNAALTPLENLDLLLRLAGRRVPERTVRDTLSSLGLGRLCRRPCGRLSVGQRRRVALARLWLTQARLWLLDEPAAALDVDARQTLCAHMADFASRGGMVLYTTHEPLALPGVDPIRIELQPC